MNRAAQHSITVIIPIHRNPEFIISSVEKIQSFLSKNFVSFEIILLDSGLGDCPGLCDLMVKKYNTVRAIHDPINTGLGQKIRRGYHEAKKDFIWMIPVDMPFSLDHIFEALPLLEEYDCVFSYRINDKRNAWRRIQTSVYGLTTRIFLGIKVRNVNSQFHVLKRDVVQPLKLISKEWFIDAEVLYYITRLNISYTEIPVEMTEDDKTKSSVNKFAFLGVLKEMFYFIAANL